MSFGEISARRNVLAAKWPSGEMSGGEKSGGEMSGGEMSGHLTKALHLKNHEQMTCSLRQVGLVYIDMELRHVIKNETYVNTTDKSWSSFSYT